jgi:hypothetical protein
VTQDKLFVDPAVLDAIVATERRMRAEQDRQGKLLLTLTRENAAMRRLVAVVGTMLEARRFLAADPDEFWLAFGELKEVHEAVKELEP